MDLGRNPAVVIGVRNGIELMARSGFVAKGIVYLLVGLLGVRAAYGSSDVGSTHTVLLGILRAPFGGFLLTVLALGLAWYAAWRFIEAFADANRKGTKPKGLAARAIYLASGGIYGMLAVDAVAILLEWDNDSGEIRSVLATILVGPLAVFFGILLLVYGVYQIWKGVGGTLSRQLNQGEARREAGKWVIALSRIGLAGRGMVFTVLGYWLLMHPAAVPGVASSSSGASGALRVIDRFPQAETFLAVTAVALIFYGAYQLVHSRYRRINVP